MLINKFFPLESGQVVELDKEYNVDMSSEKKYFIVSDFRYYNNVNLDFIPGKVISISYPEFTESFIRISNIVLKEIKENENPSYN